MGRKGERSFCLLCEQKDLKNSKGSEEYWSNHKAKEGEGG